jgi:hypothetical protein
LLSGLYNTIIRLNNQRLSRPPNQANLYTHYHQWQNLSSQLESNIKYQKINTRLLWLSLLQVVQARVRWNTS